MKAKYFVLGVLGGVTATVTILVVIMAIVVTRPVAKVATPPADPSGDIVISIAESYLGTLTTSLARAEEPSVEGVAVDVRPEGWVDMTVKARVTILGRETELAVKLVSLMQVAGGRLAFIVQEISVVGIDIPLNLLPGSLRSAVRAMEATVNESANSILDDNGFVPVSVMTSDSRVTVALRAE